MQSQAAPMLACKAVFSDGDVLARGRSFFVVHRPNGRGQPTLIPVIYYNVTRHRSDVVLDEPFEISACGLPVGLWLIRCGHGDVGAGHLMRVGAVGACLKAKIGAAVRREADAVATEERFMVRSQPRWAAKAVA